MIGAGTAPALSETAIRQLASPESFRRGRELVKDGAVGRLIRRGDELLAEVQGSDNAPYQVRVTLSVQGAGSAFACTCPYDWGGACKHVVAALLAFRETADSVEARPDAAQLLHGLERDQLQALLLALVERQPDLTDWIEAHLQTLQAAQARQSPSPPPEGRKAPEQRAQALQQVRETRQRQATVDSAPFRRQVRAALRSLDRMSGSEAYWHVGGVASEVVDVARQAQPFIEAGDGRSALIILEAVTAEYVQGWTDLDDSDGEASNAFTELAPLWTEALLSADLSTAARRQWADKLSAWQTELDDYGVEDVFDAPRMAALQGWDDPQVQRALRGEAPAAPARRQSRDDGDDEDGGSRRWGAGEVARARLRILIRQGRAEEYLNLARAEGLVVEYATELARLGRPAEAAAYGLAHLTEVPESHSLAVALLEHGAVDEALRIGEHGLSLPEQPYHPGLEISQRGPDRWSVRASRATLAAWLRDTASAAGDPERALRAALTAFQGQAVLVNYQAVQALAGARWPELREELLAGLRARTTTFDLDAPIDIFLHEGLVDDAIAVLDANPATTAYHFAVVERVADAAVRTRPEWVIQTARRQAERILDGGKSKYYREAAHWLERMRDAAAAGRAEEWRAYVNQLLVRHKRKYSLVPLLEQVLRQPPRHPG